MCEAVKAGGGHVVGAAYLGSGASHVVCHPQAAVKWLAMGELPDCDCLQCPDSGLPEATPLGQCC